MCWSSERRLESVRVWFSLCLSPVLVLHASTCSADQASLDSAATLLQNVPFVLAQTADAGVGCDLWTPVSLLSTFAELRLHCSCVYVPAVPQASIPGDRESGCGAGLQPYISAAWRRLQRGDRQGARSAPEWFGCWLVELQRLLV